MAVTEVGKTQVKLSDTSLIWQVRSNNTRDVADVPYVELHSHRLQGVVSSGSDPARVYVSYFEAETLSFGCSTNNNRPCGGLGGSPCKHLVKLLDEALLQYGAEPVISYLKIPIATDQVRGARSLLVHIRGGVTKAAVSEVFSRFLQDLHFLELAEDAGPAPELGWFPL